MGKLNGLIRTLLYRNDPELLHNPHKKDQDWFIFHGIFANTFAVLAYGTFLSGFAVFIGASDLTVGYLVLVPSICGVVSFFSSAFWRRFQKRRKLIIFINTLSRSLACLSVPVALLLPEGVRVVFFTTAMIAANMLNATAILAINNWFVSVIPDGIRGRYLSIRQFFMTVPAMILPLLFGRWLDVVNDKQWAFLGIYGVAFALMLLVNLAFVKIDEPDPVQRPAAPVRGAGSLLVPLKNPRFAEFELISMLLYFALHSSYVFTSVYMIRYLGISYQFITLSTALIYLAQLVVYRFIGQLSDRYGHRLFFKLSILLYALDACLWILMSPQSYPFLLPLRSLVAGCANATFAVSSFNYRYSIIRADERDVCEGFHVSASGIVLFIAPLAGRLLNGLIQDTPSLQAFPFAQFRLLYLLSTALLLSLAAVVYIRDGRARRRQGTPESPQ